MSPLIVARIPINFPTPAWARDEPPSPTEQIGSTTQGTLSTESRIICDTSSLQSNPLENSASRWWPFTSPTRREFPSIKPERKSFRDISLSWISASSSIREGSAFIRKDKEKEPDTLLPHIQVSVPTSTPLPTTATLPQAATPGWDTPWTSQPQDALPQLTRGSLYGSEQGLPTTNHEHLSKWSRSKKRIRSFIITNIYAPLVRPSVHLAFSYPPVDQVIALQIH